MGNKKALQVGTSAVLCLLLLFAVASCKKAAPSPAELAKHLEALKQQRLMWNLKTLVDPYDLAGNTDPRWDEPAKQALSEFARARANVTGADENWAGIISTNAALAVKSGCKDPMVNYLFLRYSLDQTNSNETFTTAYIKVAQDMQRSSYPDIRKFYASFRALNQYIWAHHYPKEIPPDIAEFQRQAGDEVQALVNDKTLPPDEIYDVCDQFLAMWKTTGNQYQAYYKNIEPPLLKNWPDSSIIWLLKGQACMDFGWQARGGGYANTVTDQGWKLFKQHFDDAKKALEKAWELNPKDPRIAVKMIWVEIGQNEGRDQMELWFKRAMDLDPNDYEACQAKALYLEPKWYGSAEQLLAFGRECVQNLQWGGRVPIILVNMHETVLSYYPDGPVKTNYWKQPEVWPDLKAAYERYFEENPATVSDYEWYAWYAYKCEQWGKLKELIPKLGDHKYDAFGGKEEFDKVAPLLKEHGIH